MPPGPTHFKLWTALEAVVACGRRPDDRRRSSIGCRAGALAAFFGCGYLIRRYEDRLTALAERAFPGPLAAVVGEKRL